MLKNKWIYFSIFLTCFTGLNKSEAHLSAKRHVDEPYLSAFSRNLLNPSPAIAPSFENSVLDQQTPYSQINIPSIPQVVNNGIVQEMYFKLRDIRAWYWNEMPQFPRRLTWILPEDGCFLRTELMVQKLKEWGYPKPKQIFAFGDLSLSTPYGTANWWYHVAPVVRVGDQTFVLDPSVEYLRPLSIKDWAQKISNNLEAVTFSLCGAGAVSPDDSCQNQESVWDPADRDSTLQNYLGTEWFNLEITLGRAPEDILGDAPPWK